METGRIIPQRLAGHGLMRPVFTRPEEVVAWFGALQAQDFLGSLWAIGQRMRSATDVKVEAAIERRALIRLWPMRGTLHFVAADDARWITRMLAPRIIARHSARWQREFGIDARLVARADDIVTGALEGGRRLSREQLYQALESRRIRTGESRGLHLLLGLAMRGRLCLAGREGKQHTFALLDEWVPTSRVLEGPEALCELAQRYFASHGPATRKDFAWWAGITLKEVALALDGATATLTCTPIDGIEYWWRDSGKRTAARGNQPQVRLLPAFDEFTVAYEDRSLLLERGTRQSKMALLSPAVLVDGRVLGTWKRTLEKQSVVIRTTLSRKLSAAETVALRAAAVAYGDYLELDVRLGGNQRLSRTAR